MRSWGRCLRWPARMRFTVPPYTLWIRSLRQTSSFSWPLFPSPVSYLYRLWWGRHESASGWAGRHLNSPGKGSEATRKWLENLLPNLVKFVSSLWLRVFLVTGLAVSIFCEVGHCNDRWLLWRLPRKKNPQRGNFVWGWVADLSKAIASSWILTLAPASDCCESSSRKEYTIPTIGRSRPRKWPSVVLTGCFSKRFAEIKCECYAVELVCTFW